MNNKIEEIIDIVSTATGISKKKLNENSKADDFSRWDSLSQVKMIDIFERKTKKKVKISQYAKFNSIKSINKLF